MLLQTIFKHNLSYWGPSCWGVALSGRLLGFDSCRHNFHTPRTVLSVLIYLNGLGKIKIKSRILFERSCALFK